MRKTIILSILLLLLTLSLAACGSDTMRQHDDNYDDPEFLAGEDRYAINTFKGEHVAESTYEFMIASLSGTRTVWFYPVEQEDQEITLRCNLEETRGGSAKLVLVDPEGGVTEIVECSAGEDSVEYSFLAQPGEYCLKIVGKDRPRINCTIQSEYN